MTWCSVTWSLTSYPRIWFLAAGETSSTCFGRIMSEILQLMSFWTSLKLTPLWTHYKNMAWQNFPFLSRLEKLFHTCNNVSFHLSWQNLANRKSFFLSTNISVLSASNLYCFSLRCLLLIEPSGKWHTAYRENNFQLNYIYVHIFLPTSRQDYWSKYK